MYRKWFSSTLNNFKMEKILPDLLISGNYGKSNYNHFNQLVELISSAGIDILPSLKKKEIECYSKFNFKCYSVIA